MGNKMPKQQSPSRVGNHSHIVRQLFKTFLVRVACWETLPAALAVRIVVLLAGELRHD